MKKYYLYIKTHNVTGLKYLGQTKQNPYKYKGSGVDWKSHIKKYGNNVNTEVILETTNFEEIKKAGRSYSKLWNIVEDDQWLNKIPETGGGFGVFGENNGMWGKTHTQEMKDAQGLRAKYLFTGKTYEEIHGTQKSLELKSCRRENMSCNMGGMGSSNGNAKHFIVTSPEGQLFEVVGELQNFCKQYNLSYSTMNKILKGHNIKFGNCLGWKIKRLI
jgi:hypothetical protein